MNTENSTPAGYSIADWTQGAGLSRPGFYNVPEEYRPKSVKIGKRHIILESPGDWLNRMEKIGGCPTKRQGG